MSDSDLYRLISSMEREREEAGTVPSHVLFTRLCNAAGMPQRELSLALNRLYVAGLILAGDTINDKYITTKTSKANGKS